MKIKSILTCRACGDEYITNHKREIDLLINDAMQAGWLLLKAIPVINVRNEIICPSCAAKVYKLLNLESGLLTKDD